MFSTQYYMAPSIRKVLGSNGCVASRRLCKQHCTTFPREVVPSLFPFFNCVFVLVFLGSIFLFEVFLGMYLLSISFLFFHFIFCYWSRVFPLGVAIWAQGFSFSLGPTHGRMQWIFSKFSLSSSRKVGTLHEEVVLQGKHCLLMHNYNHPWAKLAVPKVLCGLGPLPLELGL